MGRALTVVLCAILICIATAEIEFSEVPSDVIVAEGKQAQFKCIFTSTNAASVSWQKDGNPLIPSDKIKIDSTSLTVNSTVSDDEGTYSCIVTDQVESITETRSADLELAYILDSFLINPETKTVQEGSSTTLFCVHSGSLPAASISWTKDGITLTDSSPRFTITAGILSHADPPQTTSSLSISPLAKTDSGDYACVATNSLLPNEAVHSSSSILTVLAQLKAPTFIKHPSSLVLSGYGQTAVMECGAQGEPLPSVVWKKDDSELDTSPANISVVTSGGNSTLSIVNAQSDDVGAYHCSATNSQGSEDSSAATLKIAFIEDNFQLSPSNAIALLSEDVLFDCSPPSSYPTPSVSWSKDGLSLQGDRFQIQSNNSLLIVGSKFSDEGSYTCVATNTFLNVTRTSGSATLSVHELPVITVAPEDTTVNEGSSFSLTCNYTGVPSPSATWYKDNVQLVSVPGKIEVLTNQISVYSSEEENEGTYKCSIENEAGTAEAEATVDVIPIPVHLVAEVSLTVVVQDSVTLPCHVDPDKSLSFEWTKDGQELTLPFPGYHLLTNGSLSIASVAVSQEGQYICTASNSAGSSQGTVDLEVLVTASVVAVKSSLTVIQGQSTKISCTVSGDPTPSVTWYYDNEVVPNANSENIALGDQNTSLLFNPVLNSHEGAYVCAVDNGVGEDNDTILLNVIISPSISASPVTQTLVSGQTAVFTCLAPGDPTPTVTWLTTNSVNVLLLGDSRIEVSDDHTFSIANITYADSGSYVCRATNQAGTATAIVTLSVQVPPAVSLPGTVNATQGTTVTLDCDSSGIPQPNIFWYKDDNLLSSGGRLTIEGDVLTIENAFTTDSGEYTCKAVSVVDTVSASTLLDVRILPVILIPSPVVSVNEGDDAVFECMATGDPQPTLTWFFGSIPLPNSAYPRFSLDANDTLILSTVTHDDEGLSVVCQASSIAGKESATLTVDVNIAPKANALNTSLVTAVQDDSLRFSCVVTGEPHPLTVWYNNDIAIVTDTPGFQYVSNGESLVVASVQKNNEGNFTCVAENVAGTARDSIMLYVQVPPSFMPYPSDSIAVENSAHTMTCIATGDPTPFVQWSKGGVSFPNGSSLTLSPVSRDDAGYYTCTASNAAGSVIATVYLDVYYLPSILTPPTSLSVPVSGSASFTCITEGNPTPQIQWLFNGVSLLGAQNVVFSISDVSADDVGTYTCQVTNIVGTVSRNATLSIIVPPSPPNVTSLEATSSSSITVTWTAPLNNGGSPVTSYTLEYRPEGSSDPFQSQSASGNSLTADIQGLVAYTYYSVRIKAINIAGTGDPSEEYTPTVQTHPSSPTAPTGLAFSAVTPTTLDLSWNMPSTLNGEFGVYQLVVTTDDTPPNEVYNEILFVDRFTISDLDTSITYKIRVRASTKGIKGNALWGPYATIQVLNGVKGSVSSSATSSLSVSTSSSSKTVSSPAIITTPPPSTTSNNPTKTQESVPSTLPLTSSFSFPMPTQTLTSHFTASMTSLLPTMTSIGVTMVTTTSTFSTTSVSELKTSSSSSSSSVVVVTTSTSDGGRNGGGGDSTSSSSSSSSSSSTSSSSSESSAEPSPTVIPAPPTVTITNLTLSVTAPNSIDASWEAPTDGLDTIDGYHIYVDPVPPSTDLPLELDKGQTSITISNLQGNVEYIVAVLAYNLGGEGPFVLDSITTIPSAPSPPTNITTQVDVALGQLILQWGPPAMYDGTLERYHLLIIDTVSSQQLMSTIEITPGQEGQSQSTTQFLPASVYSVSIAAESSVGIGTPSEAITVSLLVVQSSTATSTSPPPITSTSSQTPSTTTSSSAVAPPTSLSSSSSSSCPIATATISSSCPLASPASCSCTITTVFMSPSSCATISSSSSSSSPSPIPTVIPDPPSVSISGLTLFTPSKGNMVASWQLPSSGSYNGFHLYISPSAGYTLPITVTAVTTFYQFTGLDNGVIYNVTIAAYNAGGDGPSISNSKLTIGELPGPPTNVQTILDPLNGNVLVTWSPPDLPGGTLISYHVEATQTVTLTKLTVSVAVPSGSQTNDFSTVLTLQEGDYSIAVYAENYVGEGSASEPVAVSVPFIATTTTSSSILASSSSQQLTTTTTTTTTTTSTLIITLSSTYSSSSSLVTIGTLSTKLSTTASSSSFSSSVSTFSPSPSGNETVPTISGTSSTVVAIVTPIVIITVILVVVILGVICFIQYRLYARTEKKGIFRVSLSQPEIEYELTPAPISDNKKKAPAAEGTGGGVIQTKPPRYYSQEEQEANLESSRHTNSDKEQLIKGGTQISQRNAYEESSDEENDGFVEVEPVNPIPKVGATSASVADQRTHATHQGDYTYQDVNEIRARKAKQREEKTKKQTKQQKSSGQTSNVTRSQARSNVGAGLRTSVHEMY